MSKIECSFDNPTPLYSLTMLGLFDIGVTIHAHDCDGQCPLVTIPMDGHSVVWATSNILDSGHYVEVDEGTVGGVMVVHLADEDLYEVLSNDEDAPSYDLLTREDAEKLIASGVLGS